MISGGSRGGARGTRASALLLYQTEARRAKKTFLETASTSPPPPPPPPTPLSQGLDDQVPPLPERLDPPPMIALPVWDSPAICW